MLTRSQASKCLPEVAKVPVLGVPEPMVEVGKVRQNQPQTVSVALANTGAGGKALQVSLRSDTPWIGVSEAQVSISPGETRMVAVALSPTPSVPRGDFIGRLSLHAHNAEFDREASVELRGRIVEDVRLTSHPPELQLGSARASNEPLAAALSFTCTDGRPARPEVVRVEGDSGFARSVRTEPGANGEVRLLIHTANRPPAGYLGALVVADRDPDVREVRVPVSVSVTDLPRLRCDGEYTLTAPDLRGTSSIPLRNEGGEALEVRVSSTAGWLRPETDSLTIPPAGQAALSLSYDLTREKRLSPLAILELKSNDNGVKDSLRRVWVVLQRLWPNVDVRLEMPTRPVRAGRSARVTVVIENHGEGAAHITFTDRPAWLTLEEVEVVVAPKSTYKVKATATTRRDRPGDQGGTLCYEWNAPPEEK